MRLDLRRGAGGMAQYQNAHAIALLKTQSARSSWRRAKTAIDAFGVNLYPDARLMPGCNGNGL
jgi:hypothetical protein